MPLKNITKLQKKPVALDVSLLMGNSFSPSVADPTTTHTEQMNLFMISLGNEFKANDHKAFEKTFQMENRDPNKNNNKTHTIHTCTYTQEMKRKQE